MNKKRNLTSINVLSVLVILISLFVGIVGQSNAWFTDTHHNGVQVEISVGDLKLKVYQNSVVDTNEIYTIEDNNKNGTSKYMAISGEIKPDTDVAITMMLANKDTGSAAMYVRFKFEVYARGLNSDTKLEGVTVKGFATPSGTANGFARNANDSTDEYYYYRNASGTNVLLAKDAEAKMMTHFNVPFSAFVDADGNFLITNSDTVYIKLTVHASVNQNFA